MPEYRLQRFRGGWAVALYDGGKRISRSALKSTDAAGAAAEFNRLVLAAERPADPTIRELWEAYLIDKEGRRIAKNMAWSATAVLPFFGDMKPSDVTPKLCRSYLAKRRSAGRKNGTVRTELAQLRTALLWGAKHGMIDKAPSMDMPPVSPPRERHLSRDEFDRLLEAATGTPHLTLYLLLAISTAGRNAALLELTWDRVDFDRGLIVLGERNRLRPTKGRATVPMTPDLRAALSAAKPLARTAHVIEHGGKPIAKVRTALDKAAARAGVQGVSPHVIRHSAACWMAEDGVSMEEIAAYLGHADTLITQRVYAKLSPAFLKGAARSLSVGRLREVKL